MWCNRMYLGIVNLSELTETWEGPQEDQQQLHDSIAALEAVLLCMRTGNKYKEEAWQESKRALDVIMTEYEEKYGGFGKPPWISEEQHAEDVKRRYYEHGKGR